MRLILGVGKPAPNAFLYNELNWLSPQISQRLEKIRLFCRICQLPGNRLCKRVLNLDKSPWASSVKKILDSCNMRDVWDTKNKIGIQKDVIMKKVESRLMSDFHAQLQKDIEATSKLRYYKEMKSEPGTAAYIHKCRSRQERSVIARMRSGTFRLQVEIGRARGVPRDERLCKRCDSGCVEDEIHFMLNCVGLNDLRETLYNKVTNIHWKKWSLLPIGYQRRY